KLRGAAGSLDGELDVGFWQDVGEVGLCGDDQVWRLIFDDDDAANSIFDGSVFAFGINADIEGAGISQRIVLVHPKVLDEEKFLFDGGLQKPEIDGRARAEFSDIEFREPIVEPVQAEELGIDGEAGVL